MSNPTKLLAATDFSVRGRHAGKVAIEWAQSTGAELHWVHCSEGLPKGIKASAAPMLANYVDRARSYAEKQLQESLNQSRELGIAGETHVVDGDPAEVVSQLADEIGAEGIIVGSHGHTGLKRAWLGSVAEGIVRDAACDVLVVRGHDLPFSSSIIVVGDDLTPFSEPARAAALSIAGRTGAPVEFVHSLDLGIFYLSNLEVIVPSSVFSRAYEEASEQLAALSADVSGLKITNRVVGERPATALCERAEEVHAGLIVVGCHSREGLDRALLGSIAQSVVRSSPCSVLVARGPIHTSR